MRKIELLVVVIFLLLAVLAISCSPSGNTTGQTGNQSGQLQGDENIGIPASTEETADTSEVDTNEPDRSIQASAGESEIAVQDGIEGGDAVGEDGGLPAGWPEDVPVMPGLTVLDIRKDNVDGKETMSVTLVGDVTLPDVFSFYSTLPGWQMSQISHTPEMSDTDFNLALQNEGGDMLIVSGTLDDESKPLIKIGYMKFHE